MERDAAPAVSGPARAQSSVGGFPLAGVSGRLTSLAHVYHHQERYAEAEDLFWRALTIHEGMSDLPRVALDLANLRSGLYLSDARLAETQPVFERALRIEHENQWSVMPQVSLGLDQLARAGPRATRSERGYWIRTRPAKPSS